jgi:hypothetical protein
MPRPACTELLPGLFQFADTCNVYVLRDGDLGLAVDFGSGRWLRQLPALGINRLDRVLLTHHHDDQVAGLAALRTRPIAVHAPVGEDKYLDPARACDYSGPPWFEIGCPESYLPPARRVPGIAYDLSGRSFNDGAPLGACSWQASSLARANLQLCQQRLHVRVLSHPPGAHLRQGLVEHLLTLGAERCLRRPV